MITNPYILATTAYLLTSLILSYAVYILGRNIIITSVAFLITLIAPPIILTIKNTFFPTKISIPNPSNPVAYEEIEKIACK